MKRSNYILTKSITINGCKFKKGMEINVREYDTMLIIIQKEPIEVTGTKKDKLLSIVTQVTDKDRIKK